MKRSAIGLPPLDEREAVEGWRTQNQQATHYPQFSGGRTGPGCGANTHYRPDQLTIDVAYRPAMSGLSVWFDEEGDFLELTREPDTGFFVDRGDGVFERVTEDGETIGFAVLNVSSRKQRELPFDITFEPQPSDA